jgi:hypothetical protein
MSRKPREWGNNQLHFVEDEIASWMETDTLARNVQIALRNGDTAAALINSGDIRSLAARRMVASGNARKGEYST